jgi:hypothetical protein
MVVRIRNDEDGVNIASKEAERERGDGGARRGTEENGVSQ